MLSNIPDRWESTMNNTNVSNVNVLGPNIRKEVVTCIAVCSLSLILFVAAVAKGRTLSELSATLQVTRLLPYWMGEPVAIAVIIWEAAIALALLFKRTRYVALWAYIATMFLFMAYSLWRAIKSIQVPCNCFGAVFKMTPSASFLLCLVLGGIAVALLESMPVRFRSVNGRMHRKDT